MSIISSLVLPYPLANIFTLGISCDSLQKSKTSSSNMFLDPHAIITGMLCSREKAFFLLLIFLGKSFQSSIGMTIKLYPSSIEEPYIVL